jgi:glycosyltransferase involved in cell wall biosynthesis
MDKKLVSIIIPIYNVADYLQECLDSLLTQTYENLEILLVDDGSIDKSSYICDENAKMDSRIRVIHKQNGGAASARNKGLEAATGEYICFVDSDDLVKKNYVERLLYMLDRTKTDIAVCSYEYYYQNVIEPEEIAPIGVFSEKEFIQRFLIDWKCGLLWNKIFKTSVVKGICFEEGHKIDDEFFTYKVVMNARKVVVFEENLYQYRMRASSVMQSKGTNYPQMLQDRYEYLTQRYLDVIRKYPDLKRVYLENLIDNYIRLLNDSKCSKECFEQMKLQIEKSKELLKGVHINFFLKRAFYKELKLDYKPLLLKDEEEKDKLYFR